MNYHEAINYLQNLTKFGFNFGLGRIEELMRRLGEPHKKLKVIHIGGTNGKGSTTAMTSSILKEAGYKVGTFTSPHLHSYNERYRINGEEISQEGIAQLITTIRPLLEDMVKEGYEHPTEFEVSTALAFLYFYQEAVDFLVLEVGLGGSIDSTNVVDPLVSVITNVAMDHMDYLGNSIEEITRVKAGIIKNNGQVITAADNADVIEIVKEVAAEKNAALYQVGIDTTFDVISSTIHGQKFNIQSMGTNYQNLEINLLGTHQIINAATGVTIIEVLKKKGFAISKEAVAKGLANAKWPARLEIIQEKPMVLLDGAHNLDGAVSLRKSLENIFAYKRLIMVIGMLADKEREKVLAQLTPLTQIIIVTRPNNPRSGEWQQMAEEAKKYVPEVYLEEDINQAIQLAKKLAEEEDLICITGSLYMVAEAREHLLYK